MSVDLETVPLVSTKNLEGDLVDLRSYVKAVPNHLSETRIFTSVQENSSIKTKPHVVNFEGYRVGKLHQQTLRVLNTSGDNISVHIIPPTTDHFKIHYKKERSQLVPGLGLDITVQFRPTEWKYYYDCVRIHCKGNENLLVPIHAYPIMNTDTFPRSVIFSPTPVGQSQVHTISLNSTIPVEFEYQLNYVQEHPAFTVSPMKGVVPANGRAVITVKYSPTEFSTAIMKLQLEISQFNSQPIVCTFTGNSLPGLALKKYKDELTKRITKEKKEYPRKTDIKKKVVFRGGSCKTKQQNGTEYEGIHFPSVLDTPSAVAKVLSQKSGHMKATQLKEASSLGVGGTSSGSYQLKEAVYLQRVKEVDDEEKANKLRWMRHVGSGPMIVEEKERILKARHDADRIYRSKCYISNVEDGSNQLYTDVSKRKTRRKLNELPQDVPKFDLQSNNLWLQRHTALQRFVQAARKIVVQCRCQKRLELLQRIVQELKSGKCLTDIGLLKESTEPKLRLEDLSLSPSLLLSFQFPRYVDNTKIAETLPRQLVPVQPTKVNIHNDIPLLELKVPQEYKLLGYTTFVAPNDYIPTDVHCPLRTGAEDEYQGLTPLPFMEVSHLSFSDRINEEKGDSVGQEILSLAPPPALFDTVLKHHLFNPSPDVVCSIQPLLPNSEVTSEHYLLPLPTASGAPHPQPKIDRQDGIPGVMKWRQFPSPFLASTEGQKTLTSTWRPCLSDPFSSELLPHLPHPQQLQGPHPDDLVDECMENIAVPTDDMLEAEFYIPDMSDVPVCSRRQYEIELYLEQQKQRNQLGAQHQQKYHHLLSLLNNQH